MRLLQAWLVEERREEIRRNALEAERELDRGTLKSGTVDELMADLHAQGLAVWGHPRSREASRENWEPVF